MSPDTLAGTQLNPEQVLGSSGLELPDGTEGARVEHLDGDPLTYRVTFTAPREIAVAWCSTGELGGSLPAVSLTSEEQELLGDVSLDGDPRYAASMLPGTAWMRIVVVGAADAQGNSDVTVSLREIR